jgi:hypothetical protein
MTEVTAELPLSVRIDCEIDRFYAPGGVKPTQIDRENITAIVRAVNKTYSSADLLALFAEVDAERPNSQMTWASRMKQHLDALDETFTDVNRTRAGRPFAAYLLGLAQTPKDSQPNGSMLPALCAQAVMTALYPKPVLLRKI